MKDAGAAICWRLFHKKLMQRFLEFRQFSHVPARARWLSMNSTCECHAEIQIPAD
jgi:hypothetical protein